LQLKTLEFGCANLERSGGGKSNRIHARLDLANRRYLSALKALTDLRRLAPGAFVVSASKLKVFGQEQARAGG
jgi:hypothetical protein